MVLWRLRYKLSLRDLAEMFLIRGFVFSHEAVRDWEAKLTPALAEDLRRRRKGKVGRSWYVDETYIRVHGRWKYLYRAIDREVDHDSRGGDHCRPSLLPEPQASSGRWAAATRRSQTSPSRTVSLGPSGSPSL